MDVFLNKNNSLPEQVEINKSNICKLFVSNAKTKFIYKKITIPKDAWQQLIDGKYKAVYNDEDITEDSLVIIIPDSLDTMFYYINSINYGFEIYNKNKPDDDIECHIWFNNKYMNNERRCW